MDPALKFAFALQRLIDLTTRKFSKNHPDVDKCIHELAEAINELTTREVVERRGQQ